MKPRTVLIVLALFTAASGWAQNANGRLIGTITDPSGAVVPRAQVAVTSLATGEVRTTVAGDDGAYQVLNLPIGSYTVTVEQPGFSKVVTDPQQLLINQSLRVDIHLEVGKTTETVVINSDTRNVETVNSTIGQSVTGRPVQELPLNGRNPLSLALTLPGVVETNPDSNATGSYSIGGGRSDSVTFLLDGGLNNNLLDNRVVYNPNPDTIAEFRVLQNNYTAEYGRNSGGIVSVVTKSGTNELHGSLFDYLRNDALNANTFFNNQQDQPRPVLKRQQFGGTLGGPVSIPKLFSGHDRLFFFASYQGQRQTSTALGPGVTVFTPAELQGDFSHSVDGGPDPNVASFLQDNPYFQGDASLAAQAIIDPSRIDPVARNYIKANLLPTSPTGTLFPQAASSDDRDELTGKIDYILSPKDRVSVTLGRNRIDQLIPYTYGANVNGYPVTQGNVQYFGNAVYTRTFTPTLLNEARITVQRDNQLQAKPATSLPTASELGMNLPSDNATGPPLLAFLSGLSTGFDYSGPTSLINNTFSYSDSMTWIRGKHNWKFGGGFFAYQNNTVYDFLIDGYFQFSGSAGGIGSQNDLADFLFGLPDYYTQFGAAPSNIRSKHFDGFVQDEWHVHKNLVLTLGVRYEYSTPKRDIQGRSFSVIPGVQSQRFVNAPPGLVFPGDPGAPTGANFPDKNDWAPRFGFAWDATGKGKTSIRGGFGMFYDVLKGEDNLQFNGQAPFFGVSNLFPDPLSSNPTGPLNYFADPFAATGTPNPFPSRPPARDLDFGAAGFLPFGGSGVYFVDPHLRTPYTFDYSLSIEQQLAQGLVAEATYVGSSSHKLTGLLDRNPMILGTDERLINSTYGLTPDTGFSYLNSFVNISNQSYNSLQASLTKQFSDSGRFGNTFFTLAYTWSHSIDNASGFRQRSSNVPYYDHAAFRASSDQDVRQRLSFSGGWELPFDRLWSGGSKLLTKGWSIYPIFSIRTGFPLDVLAGLSSNTTKPGPSGAGDAGLVRPNLNASSIQILDPRQTRTINGVTGNYWFDPTNLDVPDYFNDSSYIPAPSERTYGSLPRNAFRGPGRVNLDLAVVKTFDIGERLRAELRGEAFNLTNHAEFYNPGCSPGVNGVPSCNLLYFTNGNLGQVSATYDPRILQLALRLRF